MSLSEILNYTKYVKPDLGELGSTQLGSQVIPLTNSNQDLDEIDLVLLGCGEIRGEEPASQTLCEAPDIIRHEFYKLHYWHQNLNIADLGNIIQGESMLDTKAALRTVLSELKDLGKKVLVLGGSHDLTIQQYEVYKLKEQVINFSVIDMLVDLNIQANSIYNTYLLEALTSTPNYVRHFNLIGFQSYYANPQLIESLDKLHFDCLRLGKVREQIDLAEPMLRSSHMLSLDINAVKYSDAPANQYASPNGFFGDEICKLTRFAGMSSHLESFGIYGYRPERDTNTLTAHLIAQMMWYYLDGLQIAKSEASLKDTNEFFTYHITFTEQNATFLKSKRTNRWWMKMPDDSLLPCTQEDYYTACNNEIPDRWLREMERTI